MRPGATIIFPASSMKKFCSLPCNILIMIMTFTGGAVSNNRVRVGILGATGMVGQRFVQMLEHHPEFEVTALAASDRSQGKTYGEACTWRLVGDMPAFVKSMVVQPPQPPLDCDVVVSSLPSDVARSSEEAFARAGYPVISNASSYRMDEDVPLLIPEINADHLNVLGTPEKRARLFAPAISSRIRIARRSSWRWPSRRCTQNSALKP